MTSNRVIILSQQDVQARLKRIAFEIYENNFQASKIILLGSDIRGSFLADQLRVLLQDISPIEVETQQAMFDQKNRQGRGGSMQVTFSHELHALQGEVVVIIDDVLYSGNTMLHLVAPMLEVRPKKIEVAVLIDRGHRITPISPTYVGLELATTIQQHVMVEIDEVAATVEAFLV